MQLQQAVRLGDDRLVRVLDRELEPLIAAVLAYKAENVFEVHMQLQFMSNLIREDADDRSCVRRHSASLSVLLDRYFGSETASKRDVVAALPIRQADANRQGGFDDSLLNEVILDSLPDRVAVITPDYRYLYSNPVNAASLNRNPIDLVGHHIVEFIGTECFEKRAKARLDACFAGNIVDYIYERRGADGVAAHTRCRMTPLRTASNVVIGAVVIIQDAVPVSVELAA